MKQYIYSTKISKSKADISQDYPWADGNQVFEIWRGLKDGLDVSIYADPKFNSDQMLISG